MTPHQKHLAKLAERDRQFAAMFNRTSKYAVTMTEGHDSGGQQNDTAPQYGEKSAFQQIAGTQEVLRTIR